MKTSSEKQLTSGPKHYDTVVVGTGPVGLLSALSAMSAIKKSGSKKKVALVADRLAELGVRQQVLWIEKDVMDFIKETCGEERVQIYMDSLAIIPGVPTSKDSSDPGHYITTGDMEKLFFDTLLGDYNAREDYDIYEIPVIRAPKLPHEAMQFDLTKKTLTLPESKCNRIPASKCNRIPAESPPTLDFQHLIEADGAKASVTKALVGQAEIDFDKMPVPLPHTHHVVATFSLPQDSSPHYCLKHKTALNHVLPYESKKNPLPLSQLKEKYGWKLPARPHSQVYTSDNVIYIGVEMPEQIIKIENQEERRLKAQDYALDMMKDWLPSDYIKHITVPKYDESAGFGRKQRQLSVSMFDIELGQLNKSTLRCGSHQEGVIFIMGDALKKPLYTTGTGVQTGIREAMCFKQYVDHLATHPEDIGHALEHYDTSVQKIIEDNTQVQEKWVQKRQQTSDKAVKTLKLFDDNSSKIDSLINLNFKLNKLFSKLTKECCPEDLVKFQARLDLFMTKNDFILGCFKGANEIMCYASLDIEAMLVEWTVCEKALKEMAPSLEKKLGIASEGDRVVLNEMVSLCVQVINSDKSTTAEMRDQMQQLRADDIKPGPKNA